MKRIVEFASSLKITAVLLAFSVIIVFVGTIAQADEGLYAAQAKYFKHWFAPNFMFFGKHVPIPLPGGYLLGTLLLVNLVMALVYRFELSWKKIGIEIAHIGIIVLLVGQLVTDMFSQELFMSFFEGQTKDYSDSSREHELLFISGDKAVSIPERLLRKGGDIKVASLPFTIRVKQFWPNSDLAFRAPMMKSTKPLITTNGVGANFDFEQADEGKSMEARNAPTAILEFITPDGRASTWIVSSMLTDAGFAEQLRAHYARQGGAGIADRIVQMLLAPQQIEAGGKTFTFGLKLLRVQHTFSLTLLKATHTTYPGTDIPKDFRSRVRIDNKETGEKREVEISMNHPLRYGGYTYYQYQMSAGEMIARAGQTPSSGLQVVKNPSWLTPYIGCTIVSVGLLAHFLISLSRFLSRRQPK